MTRASRTKFNFTETLISKYPTQPKRFNIFDASTRGLGLCIQPGTGAKSWFHLRKVLGRPQRVTIGLYPEISLEQARMRADGLNAAFAKWKGDGFEGPNPIETPKKKNPTLGEAFEHYYQNQLLPNAKPTSQYEARRMMDLYLSTWRNRPLSSIQREHVRDLHTLIASKRFGPKGNLGGGPQANRVITFLRAVFSHASHPDIQLWSGINPCSRPKKFLSHEKSRDRHLKRGEESVKFFDAVSSDPHPDLKHFIYLAVSTAARRGTIFRMRWDQIDLKRGVWVIPDPKGDLEVPSQVVPLTDLAVSTLIARQGIDEEWVFPGQSKGQPIKTIDKPWRALLSRCKIENFHIHDLRRSLIVAEGESGASTEAIQKTLNHVANSEATRRYDRASRQLQTRKAMQKGVTYLLAGGKTSKRKLFNSACV